MAKNLLLNQKPLVLAVFAALNCSSVSYAAVNFTGAYSQTFDTLTSSTSAAAWANDSTLSGWHLFNQTNTAITAYTGSTGSGTAGSFYSFGNSSDRALGGLGSGGAYFGSPASGAIAGWIAFSAVNTTGSTIQQVAIAFDGEQWRNGGNATSQNMVLEYGFGTEFTSVASWTAPGGNFDWTSPVASSTAASVDGNSTGLASNRGGTLTGLNWTNGSTLWLRWVERNDVGNDHGLALDNFSLTSASSSVLLSINDVSVSEGNSGTTDYTFTVNLSAPAPASGVSFDIATADNTASSASGDYASKNLTNQTIPAGSSSYTFTVAVNGDTSVETNETFFVNITNVVRATVLDGQGQGTIQNDDVAATCSEPDTAIGAIQGSGDSAALTGSRTVQGVVVGDYEGASPNLRGFYLQNTPVQSDGDDATSDGIFVFNSSNNTVSLGQVVQVTGSVVEFNGQTQIESPNIVSCGETATITPVNVTLPVASASYLERYEGMLVKFAQTLFVTEHFQLGRFGQAVLSANSRLAQPTNVTTPGANALALQASNSLNRIIVDDELQSQNPDPILFGRNGNPLSASNTLRGGDSVANLVGVMTYTWSGNSASGNAYRLRPINALNASTPNFVASNPRPTTPAQLTGRLKVVSANLLNFFNTFGINNCMTGVGGAATDCRGADNQTEFDRQWPKTVANLIGTGADVIIVNELENDGYGANSAMQFLVNKMNASAGAGTYAFIDVDANTGQTNALGTDAIKVGMIYQSAEVTPVGTTAALATGALGLFQTGSGTIGRSRPALAQAFEENSTGERFIAVANHFKSKGSSCSDNVSMLTTSHATTAIVGDVDAGDGQGQCNKTRTAAAEELVYWLDQDPTGTGETDILIVGDLNSYAKEDPVTAIKNDGYSNLIEAHIGDSGYSYVFDGQWGYLDHALGSASIVGQVQDVLEWHINADEPSVLDYNTNFKSANQLTSLYAIDAFRTSDHDPIIVGLNLNTELNVVSGTKKANVLIGTSGKDKLTGFAGRDTLTGGDSRDLFVFRSVQDGIDTITDFTANYDKIVLTPLLQGLGITSSNAIADGYVKCSDVGANSVIAIDADANGPAVKRPLVLAKGIHCAALAVNSSFSF